jgi:predicted dehydrogenase
VNKIKLGIVGLGAIGNRMIKSIAAQYSEQIEVVAVCDENAILAQEVTKEFSIKHYYDNHSNLLNEVRYRLYCRTT